MLVNANSVMTVHKPSMSKPSPAKLRELLAMDAVTNAVQYLLAWQLFTHTQETLEGGFAPMHTGAECVACELQHAGCNQGTGVKRGLHWWHFNCSEVISGIVI